MSENNEKPKHKKHKKPKPENNEEPGGTPNSKSEVTRVPGIRPRSRMRSRTPGTGRRRKQKGDLDPLLQEVDWDESPEYAMFGILDINEGPLLNVPDNIHSKDFVKLANLSTTDDPDFQDSLPPIISEQFEALSRANAIYLEELADGEIYEFLTGKHNYEIKTNGGGRIFVATDVSEDYLPCFCCHGGSKPHDPFMFNICDYSGRQVLQISGHLSSCAVGVCVKIGTNFDNMGSIVQGDITQPNYVVINWAGKEVYSIHHVMPGNRWRNLGLISKESSQFGIFQLSEVGKQMIQVGSLLPIQTRHEINKETHEMKTCEAVKLTCPENCEPRNKILLLGALFVVDYRIVKREGRLFQLRGHEGFDRWITIPCAGICFAALIGLAALAALVYELIVGDVERERG